MILAVLVIFAFLVPVTIDRAGDQIIYFTVAEARPARRPGWCCR